jgi:hypothetical protein
MSIDLGVSFAERVAELKGYSRSPAAVAALSALCQDVLRSLDGVFLSTMSVSLPRTTLARPGPAHEPALRAALGFRDVVGLTVGHRGGRGNLPHALAGRIVPPAGTVR